MDKETWKIGTDRDKMEGLIKYNMHVQFSSNVKQFTVFSMNIF